MVEQQLPFSLSSCARLAFVAKFETSTRTRNSQSRFGGLDIGAVVHVQFNLSYNSLRFRLQAVILYFILVKSVCSSAISAKLHINGLKKRRLPSVLSALATLQLLLSWIGLTVFQTDHPIVSRTPFLLGKGQLSLRGHRLQSSSVCQGRS